ncbi:MAG: DNA mismatch repair protein MutS [Phycisphaera sp.]|nr:DNA mismatch repair protein MutS [Phycisphaera sp.]
MPAKLSEDTPAMRQYRLFKERHPECVLFFRMGDFYEMFHDDAKLAHRVLGVTLTQRTEGVPMAGVPYHSVEGYLRRMIEAGYRVAVCDQVEDAAKATGAVVRRDVTRVITPGTLTDESLLDEGRENPLAAVVVEGDQCHLAWAELSTGAFCVTSVESNQLSDTLARIAPGELLVRDDQHEAISAKLAASSVPLTRRPAWQFRPPEASQQLKKQFHVATLEGFGLTDDDPLVSPAGAVVAYLLETQCAPEEGPQKDRVLPHLRPPVRVRHDDYLLIDETSLRSLEIERTTRSGQTDHTLLGVFLKSVVHGEGGCRTALGKRTLRHFLCFPLRDPRKIEERQNVVASLVDDARFRGELSGALDSVQDVQRIAARVGVNRATPRDLVALGRSVAQARKLADLLDQRPTVRSYYESLTALVGELDPFAKSITDACVDSPPAHLRDGGLFKDGHDAQLDESRLLQRDSHAWLARYQKQLVDASGIPSLKVGYNKVFGYYIEVTAAHRDKVDAALENAGENLRGWHRKQTLKNTERFITDELKTFEGKVLGAQSQAIAREQELFTQLCEQASGKLDALHRFAVAVGELDALSCFAHRAARKRYVRPTLVAQPVLDIRAGRHPVLDELLGDRFVANDVQLGDADAATLALITGPNMAGKSTFIRQAALLTLLAHTGSFVPAQSATVGLCDRIFTRIGASDELHAGQSTFMVEMTETAHICHHATPGSLVILDEIGRGTSTLDGLSLAWAITEHLAARGCRTLFATHYHEITALADELPGVMNLNVTVREWQDQVVFLHRIAPGRADKSYGIHVARIAGLPPEVVKRADQLLAQLEVNHREAQSHVTAAVKKARDAAQMSLFTEYVEHPAMEALRKLDLNSVSPMQAFEWLRRLREQLER